jgi:hypothetical protein
MGFRLCRATVALTFALSLVAVTPAHADPETTFIFTGVCSDCRGTGVGTLVVQDYTAGVAMDESNFVSFTYSSNLDTFDVSPSDTDFSFDGTLGDTAGSYDVDIENSLQLFTSSVDGSWSLGDSPWNRTGNNPTPGNPTPPTLDLGPSSTYVKASLAATPEPSSVILLGTGLAGILVRWRCRR